MIHQPFRCSVEQRGRRVDIDWCSLNQSLVALLWVFLGGVSEKPGTNRSANEVIVATSREDIMFVSKKRQRTVLADDPTTYLSMMPNSCFRTSSALRTLLAWMKFSKHHGFE